MPNELWSIWTYFCFQELETPHKSMVEMMTRQYLEKAGGHGRRTSSTSDDPQSATATAPAPTPAPGSSIPSTIDEDVFEANYLKPKQKSPKG